MNIGFTYDLKSDYLNQGLSHLDVAEFDSPQTINGIADSLSRLGHSVTKIGNLTSLIQHLATNNHPWDLVFNIAEGLHGQTRESQIPALLEAHSIPTTFADSLVLALALHKGFCKNILRDHHIPTPPFTVITSEEDTPPPSLHYPLFAKPVAEGTGKGVSPTGKAASPDELKTIVHDLLSKFKQPVIVEEFLPGREFTVGITGTGPKARVLAVMEVLLLDSAEPEVYSFENKDKYEDRVRYRLVDDPEAAAAADIALRAYRILGCRDAGRADLRSDENGNPMFMEINPLAGLNPVHSDLPIMCRLLGKPYDDLINDIVESAAERIHA